MVSQDVQMTQQFETPQFIAEPAPQPKESSAFAEDQCMNGSHVSDKASSANDLYQSSISDTSVKSPKQLYMEKVIGESNAQLRESLVNLYDFGFIDFHVNRILLQKYKDANVVAEKLCSITSHAELQKELNQ